MTEAERYRRAHALLGSAKRAGWQISRTAAGCWGCTTRADPPSPSLPRPASVLAKVDRVLAMAGRQHWKWT